MMTGRCLYIYFTLTLLVLASLTSCEHKEIVCPPAKAISVVFEWDRASQADVAGMTLLFYPLEDDGGIWRYDIAGEDGGPVMLPPGSYELIAYNNDLPGISLGDTQKPSTIYASALSVGSADDPGVYASTGMLYRGEITRLEVTPCGVRYVTDTGAIKECGRRTVRCHPDSMSTAYTVNLTDISGADRIRSASAVLEGVRSSILLESDRPGDTPAALVMDMGGDVRSGDLSGSGCAFAPPDARAEKYRLRLRIKLADGRSVERRFDIKPDNLNIITRHNVVITVDGIVIPDSDPSTDIGGIGAFVDGWQVVEITPEPTF